MIFSALFLAGMLLAGDDNMPVNKEQHYHPFRNGVALPNAPDMSWRSCKKYVLNTPGMECRHMPDGAPMPAHSG